MFSYTSEYQKNITLAHTEGYSGIERPTQTGSFLLFVGRLQTYLSKTVKAPAAAQI